MGHSTEKRTVFVHTSERKGTGKNAGKKKRDPSAPKKALNGYSLFLRAQRVQMKGEKDALKRLGEEWKALSEEAKKPYLDEAALDKSRYEKEMLIYRRDHPEPKKSKDMSEEELAYIAASQAINDFVEDEMDDHRQDSWSDDDDGYDRVQPPCPGSLTYIPLPQRATAAKTIEMLEAASWSGDKKNKQAVAWLEQAFQRDAREYIDAYRSPNGYTGVIVPFSKSEENEEKKRYKAQWGDKGDKKAKHPRGKHFIVVFDYHH
jgi:hypothetical protein